MIRVFLQKSLLMTSAVGMLVGTGAAFAEPGRNPQYDKLNVIPKVDGEVVTYDPNTKVYVDALFFRVHAADCPRCFLKDKKQSMTLAEADKAGAAISSDCFPGYQRKHPLYMISDDHVMYGPARAGVHYFGCIYIENANSGTKRKTVEEWKAEAARFCHRCAGNRRVGPSYTLTAEEWQKVTNRFKWIEEESKRQREQAFPTPEGWTARPIDPENPPSREDLDMLVKGVWEPNVPSKLETLYFKNRVAMHETLMTKRFFFGPPQTYYAYRATGDQRLLDQMLRFARNRQRLCDEALDVYQYKTRDPEGVPAAFDMVAWSRITLQKAMKYPGTVSEKEIAEAEGFLKTVIQVLKPTWEANDHLDPDMGIPVKLADDFRNRAFNRAATGIGTIAMAAVALEDLQRLKRTKNHQSTIDRYRKCVTEWVENFKSVGCLYTEADGKTYFYYPYKDVGRTRRVNGLMLGGADDRGHYSITVMGLQLIYEAVPESGIDDDFMTAVANTIYYNSGTNYGSPQCPSADKIEPQNRKRASKKPNPNFYVLEAFRDGVIDGQSQKLNEAGKEEVLSTHKHRLRALHAQYMEALRKDRSLVHLGEKM